MKKTLLVILALANILWLQAKGKGTAQTAPIIVAYVCSWTTQRLPDPFLMTHINYAFGHVNKTFDGCDVQNPDFLTKVVELKKKNPKLRVSLSVGGWTSGNFSEMAADAGKRRRFAEDCARIVAQYGIDGIDIDWEYPTSSEAGISSSADDTRNFTLLMRDLRKAIGKDKLLTIATIADAKYIDFRACMRYLDFVNIMAYDVADPPLHHTTLYRSQLTGRISVQEAVEAHIKAGVPRSKLCLGMPLYGRGDHSNKILDNYMRNGFTAGCYTEHWDERGQVPYLTDWSGLLVWAADNPRSIAAKCQYILDEHLLGGMYWQTTEDNAQCDLMNTVYLTLIKNKKATVPPKQILLITDEGEDSTLLWLREEARKYDAHVAVWRPDSSYAPLLFEHFHLIYNNGTDPAAWPDEAKKDFQKYIDEAQGAYLGFEADDKTPWAWYNDFVDHAAERTCRSVLYKLHPGLGYMPRLSSYVETRGAAVKWLLNP